MVRLGRDRPTQKRAGEAKHPGHRGRAPLAPLIQSYFFSVDGSFLSVNEMTFSFAGSRVRSPRSVRTDHSWTKTVPLISSPEVVTTTPSTLVPSCVTVPVGRVNRI